MEKEVIFGKKGQFYIISVIIIISILVGIGAISNYVKTKPVNTKIYDLGEEFDLETGNVIDYGIYNEENLENLIENWSGQYYEYSKSKYGAGEWVLVYGDKDNVTLLSFANVSLGEIEIQIGENIFPISSEGAIKRRQSFIPVGNEIMVNVLNSSYDFELKGGENFFFVIRKGESVISR